MPFAKGSPCTACNPVRDWSEFLKILERGDVGITIYRFRGQPQDDMGRSNRSKETFIFYTTKKVTERPVGMDIYIAEAKCMNYCPRCIEMMRRVEALFGKTPPDREADLCEIFSCPPCVDLVHKFRKFTADDNLLNKQHDSELIHLQRLTSPSTAFNAEGVHTARTTFENLVKLEAKDTEVMNKEGAKDKDHKSKATKLPKDLEKFSKKAVDKGGKEAVDKGGKEAVDKGGKEAVDKGGKQVAGNIKNKVGKEMKEKEADEDLKIQSVEAQKSLDEISKGKKTKSGEKNDISGKKQKEQSIKSKSASKLVSMSTERNPLIRMKIAEAVHKQAKEEQALRNQALQIEKDIKNIDVKLDIAAKNKEEARIARQQAEMARQLKFKAAMAYVEENNTESGDNQTEVCFDDPEIDWMIKGNRLCKVIKRKEEQVEKSTAGLSSITSTQSSVFMPLPRPRPSPTPVNGNETTASNTTVRKNVDGRLRYHLSERKYVDNGWTVLPKEMVMRKVTLFQMHPARNELDWLEMNRHRERVFYDSGELLASFDENGCARVYYRSGVLALNFYQAQEKNAGGYRVVVYSDGKPVDRGRAPLHTVLATFDYSGNGAVFDHTGQPRLKYSQNDGVVLDRGIGPYTHWKWHNLNDTSRLQTVLIENEPKYKDPNIMKLDEDGASGKRAKSVRQADEKSINQGDEKSGNKTDQGSQKSVYLSLSQKSGNEKDVISLSNDEKIMRDIESNNIIKENNRLLKKFSPFQIRMKAFKINEYFALRIIDQPSVFLTFTDGRTRLRINVGMIIDPTVVLGQEMVEVGEVTSSLDKLATSESVEELQRVVRGARAAERARVLREHKLNPPLSHDPPPCAKNRHTH